MRRPAESGWLGAGAVVRAASDGTGVPAGCGGGVNRGIVEACPTRRVAASGRWLHGLTIAPIRTTVAAAADGLRRE